MQSRYDVSNQYGVFCGLCLDSSPSSLPPPPSVVVYWGGDSIVETGAAMHQPYPLVKKKIHNVHTVAQILISTQYNTHKHPAHPSTTILTPLAVGHCLVRVFVWGYSGTQGNGTWGYSGLNGSSGYAAAHKVPVWAPQRLMCLCTQCLAQLQRTGVCMSLNCRPVV